MGYNTSLVEKFGWCSANVVGDNTAAIASVKKLCATPRASPGTKSYVGSSTYFGGLGPGPPITRYRK